MKFPIDDFNEPRTDRGRASVTQSGPHRLTARNPGTTTADNWLTRAGNHGPPSFIQVYPDVVSKDVCAEIIRRFEADPRVRASWGSDFDQPRNRSGSMLEIGRLPEWRDLTEIVMVAMEEPIHHYADVFMAFKNVLMTDKCYLSLPLMERIDPSQGFDWHFDGNTPGIERRVLANILYLADVADGGETQFAYQRAVIAPKAGSMAVFPPFWTHLHRGASPESTIKYNITNFVNLDKSAP